MLTVIRPTEAEETRALLLFRDLGPQGAGFVDCISFAVMHANRMDTAFTFDSHFALAGFKVIPSP